MLKFFLMFLLTFLLVYFVGPFFPYWALMIGVAILAIVIGGSAGYSFLGAALGFGLGWLVISLIVAINTDSDLPDKMAALLGLSNISLLWILPAILGFLIGGFSALTGNLFRRLFEKKERSIYGA